MYIYIYIYIYIHIFNNNKADRPKSRRSAEPIPSEAKATETREVGAKLKL